MSVALNRVEGIESVNVTLKRGVAHVVLEPGNSVSLEQVRKIVKDAGYSSRDAVVVARGTVESGDRGLVLEVTGSSTRLLVAADIRAPQPFADLRTAVRAPTTLPVEVTGTVAAPKADQKGPDTLVLRSFTIKP